MKSACAAFRSECAVKEQPVQALYTCICSMPMTEYVQILPSILHRSRTSTFQCL